MAQDTTIESCALDQNRILSKNGKEFHFQNLQRLFMFYKKILIGLEELLLLIPSGDPHIHGHFGAHQKTPALQDQNRTST